MAQKKLASERWKILRNAILSAKGNSSEVSSPATTASVRSFSSFNLFNVASLSKESLPDFLRFTDDVSVHVSACGDVSNEWLLYSSTRHHDSDECPTKAEDVQSSSASIQLTTTDKSVVNCSSDKVHTDGTLERLTTGCHGTQAVIKYITSSTTLEAMIGFNNTGNVCIWPSEEVLAYYCLKHCELFRETAVCELGCGMTGLAGIMLANTRFPSQLLLTDGNSMSIENVKVNILANKRFYSDVTVFADVLLWDTSFIQNTSSHDAKYDYVICADCLFFETVHSELAQVILKLLKPNGCALMFAPTRGGTLEKFCSIAQDYFKVKQTECYDSVVWEKHQYLCKQPDDKYQTDLHYPIMLELQKSS